MKKKPENTATLVRVIALIKPYLGLLLLSLLFAVATVVATLYTPVLIGEAVDYIIGPGQVDFEAIRPILIKLLVVVAIMAATHWIMNLCNNRIAYHGLRFANQGIQSCAGASA